MDYWKVLVVSDSAYQVDVFRHALEGANFHVSVAGDGRAGLEAIRRENPRIIISDLEMPGMNGIELCRAVKRETGIAPNHFIICTANEKKVKSRYASG